MRVAYFIRSQTGSFNMPFFGRWRKQKEINWVKRELQLGNTYSITKIVIIKVNTYFNSKLINMEILEILNKPLTEKKKFMESCWSQKISGKRNSLYHWLLEYIILFK